MLPLVGGVARSSAFELMNFSMSKTPTYMSLLSWSEGTFVGPSGIIWTEVTLVGVLVRWGHSAFKVVIVDINRSYELDGLKFRDCPGPEGPRRLDNE